MSKLRYALLLSCLTSLSYAGTAPSFEGNYQCQRSDPASNTPVSYPVSIAKTGDTYNLQWANDKGYPIVYGTGVNTKNLPNAISVVFWDSKDPNLYGVEIFELKSDGTLQANWALQSENKVGSETCTKS